MWFLPVLLAVGQVLCDEYVIVETTKGPIKGKNEGNYDTFLGVPYAKVKEDNPFGVSAPYPNFTEPFEALDGSIKCPQAFFTAEGTLDCLRLNIYVPHRKNDNKLAVLVWFHGGGFFFGSAGDYDGKYLVQQDIIVVIANYRLGPYGFLCLNDPEVPGNQGLKDQIDVLKWVRENIHAFGGESGKITIAGESYGGGAVDLHIYSNFYQRFDKAIVQSGSVKDEAFFVKPDYDAAIKLAKLLNHTATNNKDALTFLAKVDPLQLMIAFNSSDLLLRVCKEKRFKHVQSFVTDDPFHLHRPSINLTPILFGYCSKETFGDFVGLPEDFYENNQDIIFDKLNSTLDMKSKDIRKLSNVVKKFYLGGQPVTKENMLPLVDFMSDFVLNYAAEDSVTRLVDDGANLYKYLFSYTGNSPYKNVTGVGAHHTAELPFLFVFEGQDVEETEENLMMRNRMTTLWGNFVKYGNPTPNTSELLPVVWTPIPEQSRERPYLNIDLEMTMMTDLYHERVAFWDLLWKSFWSKSRIRI